VGIRELQPVDVIAGGFPCQDISNAGKRIGISGERSGLWSEFSRIIGELRPRFVLVENVAALLVRGIETVLGDLAAIGYDAEWQIISAADMGAPHLRKRVWILGYPHESVCGWNGRTILRAETQGCSQWNFDGDMLVGPSNASEGSSSRTLAYAFKPRLEGYAGDGSDGAEWKGQNRPACKAGLFADVPDTSRTESDRWADWTCGWEREPQEALCDARRDGRPAAWQSIPESLLGRVVDGVPYRVDRLSSLGNAVVPQIPEMIARRMIQHFQEVPV
jgi:DNA (cytosine-5)-methyltransferase 1